jgi:ABC-type polysaccharide/polyol phosphate export permease
MVGTVWALIHPAITILAFWFVSAYGLRISFEQGPPYFLLLFTGIIPWMTFSEAVMGGAGAVLSYEYLVKKIAFPLEILPIVKITSAAAIHLLLIALLIVILVVSGIPLTLHAFEALYFFVAMLVLVTGIAWTLAALEVFHRDVGHAVTALLTVWFWLTPILWPAQHLTAPAKYVVALNPLFYIVEGYRSAFLQHRVTWSSWPLDVYFWAVAGTLFLLGAFVFNRLKPHFADVL